MERLPAVPADDSCRASAAKMADPLNATSVFEQERWRHQCKACNGLMSCYFGMGICNCPARGKA